MINNKQNKQILTLFCQQNKTKKNHNLINFKYNNNNNNNKISNIFTAFGVCG